MIKYRTTWSYGIEAVEVSRETAKTVVLRNAHGLEIRENKRSDWQNWHDTWEGAHQFLLYKAEDELNSAKMELQKARDRYGNIKRMKKP